MYTEHEQIINGLSLIGAIIYKEQVSANKYIAYTTAGKKYKINIANGKGTFEEVPWA